MAGSAIRFGEHCSSKTGWYSITCVLDGTRRDRMREEVWLGERGGRVISLRSRVMLGFMMDYVPQLLLHAMAMVDCR